MKLPKTLLTLLVGGALSLATVPVGFAQVVIAGPPVLVPTVAPPIVLPSAYPVVSTYPLSAVTPRVTGYGTYRPIVNTYPLPTAAPSVFGYNTYRPVVSAPVYVAPVSSTVARPVSGVVPSPIYRPAVIGTGIGGLPTLYVPGQPVRNAMGYVLP